MNIKTLARAAAALSLILALVALVRHWRPRAVRPRPRIQGTRRRVRDQGPGHPAQGVREDQGRLSRDPLSWRPSTPASCRPRSSWPGSLEDVLALQGGLHGQGPGPVPPPQSQHDGRPARQPPQPRRLRRPEGPGRRPRSTGTRPSGRPGTRPPSKAIPQEQREYFKTYAVSAVELIAARAHLNAGDAAKAQGLARGLPQVRRRRRAATISTSSASVAEKLGRDAEALDAYLAAAVEEYPDAADKAKALYTKIHGSADGFVAALRGQGQGPAVPPRAVQGPGRLEGEGRAGRALHRARSARRASGPISPSTRSSRPSRPSTWPSSSITCPFPGPTR
ncbi:MAG: hypothetical protein M0C28_42930 [Candidatus Moduliflexus flocculans]|nr:hypothetical protein [Candidatus Moduliflexus flocculans]